MKKNTILIIILFQVLIFNPVSAQITFGFDSSTAAQNNVPNGTEVTETISGITVTIKDAVDPFGGPSNITLIDGGGVAGTTGNIVSSGDTSTVTVTFSEAVDVTSVLIRDRNGGSLDLTFTPTGGSNSVVIVPLVNGLATNNRANLNWTEITSFTVTSMGPVGEDYTFDDLSVTPMSPPVPITVFDFDSNTTEFPPPNDIEVTQTKDGITLTVEKSENVFDGLSHIILIDGNDFAGTTGKNVEARNTRTVTFTFSTVVDVHSVLVRDRLGGTVDLTFTPTGGSNSDVLVPLVNGFAPNNMAVLNWTSITSFTVTSSLVSTNTFGEDYAFDDVRLNATLSTNNYNQKNTIVHPNPVKNKLNIENVSGIRSIRLFNNLGQLILQSKKETIDLSHLTNGIYFLQIRTDHGTEIKRIIKN